MINLGCAGATWIKWQSYVKETPTRTELTLVHAKGLHAEVEGEEGEVAVDAVVLLLVAHVGAAERSLPETQVVVPPGKGHPLKDTQTHESASERCARLNIEKLFIPDLVFPIALKTCRWNFFVSC